MYILYLKPPGASIKQQLQITGEYASPQINNIYLNVNNLRTFSNVKSNIMILMS